MIVWSIGLIPVQEWISEARRSRDLKIGSAVLSWLMGGCLKTLSDNGARILVPSLSEAEIEEEAGRDPRDLLLGVYGISNRASGCWNAIEPSQAVKTFEHLQGVIEEKWTALRTRVRSRLRPPLLASYADSATSPFRLIWCLAPHVVNDESQLANEDRIEALRKIDRLYAAVKRTRPIVAYRGAPVEKCGQCARRDAAGPSDWNAWRSFQKRLENEPEIQEGHRLDVGERLCGVCLVKRFAGYLSDKPFPSTSEIAASEWLDRIRNIRDLQALVGRWRKEAEEIEGDDPYPLLYKRTVERRRKASTTDRERAGLVAVGERVDALSTAIEQRHPALPSHPSDYLAVLTFDGDDMGRRVQNEPQIIPPALLSFAKAMEGDLQRAFRARPFYLGGDEGLVLCPIETSMSLAAHIRETFEREVARRSPAEREAPTISVGMAIFDRERPLAAAIQSARSALELAKSLDRKNALGVTVTTASGSSWTTVDHWGTEWDRVFAAIELGHPVGQRGEAVGVASLPRLSSGWAYDVESLLETLPSSFFDREAARNALREEVRRITYRRVLLSQETRTSEATATERAKREVWEKLHGPKWWTNPPDFAQRDHLASQLHLIAFLLRETQPAGGEEALVAESEVAV